jgi:hypothetical protein
MIYIFPPMTSYSMHTKLRNKDQIETKLECTEVAPNYKIFWDHHENKVLKNNFGNSELSSNRLASFSTRHRVPFIKWEWNRGASSSDEF